ncbi:MAG TPA: CbtA family protein [Nitrososphaeraceae archaeon]|nr:CbtA family protein [Nitrososphaeraceae archaeon]
MNSISLLAVTIFSGAIAGTILAIINLGLVEPYIDSAISLETQRKISSGENVDMAELVHYRIWQKGGAIAAGAVYGISLGALFGIVFAYGRKALPGKNNRQKALFLAGILWIVLYLMVAIKYPANPPAVGDPETIYYRQSLYVTYLAISGFTALALALAWNRVQLEYKKILFPLIYAAVMIVAYIVLPPNPDKIGISMDLIHTFRIVTALTIGIFWAILAIVFGSLWDRFIPREEPKFATM